MSDTTLPQPLSLTTSDYWLEIDEHVKKHLIPLELGNLIKLIINCHVNRFNMPMATQGLIDLVKRHIGEGIDLHDSAGERLYDIIVVVPDKAFKEEKKTIFGLQQKWPGCRVRYLDEL